MENSSNKSNKTIISISEHTTPIGSVFICATENGICLVEFVDRKILETRFQDLENKLNATIVSGENDHIKRAKQELDEYFSGTRKKFTVKIITLGTAFQNAVWAVLQYIPYGKTVSYQTQAEKLNNPKAIRAMASANGQNRISIIIPCHRVIGKNGKMTGYAGGIERKKWLIEHEQKNTIPYQLKIY